MILNEETGSNPKILYGFSNEYGHYLLDDNYTGLGELSEADKRSFSSRVQNPNADDCIETSGSKQSGVAPNGSNIYISWHDNLALTSPYCSSLFEIIMREVAAEQQLADLFQGYVNDGLLNGFQLQKQSTDSAGNCWGALEICQTPEMQRLSKHGREILKALRMSHQLTRVIYTGEGGFIPAAEGLRYVISPRLALTSTDLASQRTLYPILYSVDHQETKGVLQNCGAANISPWAIAVKHGMNSILPKLATVRDFTPPIVHNVFAVKDQIAGAYQYDPTIVIDHKHKLNAADIQRKIAQEAQKNCDLTEEEIWVAEQVIEVCDALESDPEAVENRVDHTARRLYLEARGLTAQPAPTRLADLSYAWSTICITDRSRRVEGLAGKAIKDRNTGSYGWHNIEQPTTSEVRQTKGY